MGISENITNSLLPLLAEYSNVLLEISFWFKDNCMPKMHVGPINGILADIQIFFIWRIIFYTVFPLDFSTEAGIAHFGAHFKKTAVWFHTFRCIAKHW